MTAQESKILNESEIYVEVTMLELYYLLSNSAEGKKILESIDKNDFPVKYIMCGQINVNDPETGIYISGINFTDKHNQKVFAFIENGNYSSHEFVENYIYRQFDNKKVMTAAEYYQYYGCFL